MADKFTVRDFFARFPSDDACLEHIMEVRYGLRHDCRKCGVNSTFHRMSERRAYACANCGDHIYPTAGTIFQDSRTSLQMWFYCIFLFVTTRHGVSGKEGGDPAPSHDQRCVPRPRRTPLFSEPRP